MNGGEIVEVDGGHIIRSRGRKDRHSKVCTAKGPRDRRVRLSAHTAIEFYDVQDRLGFDRPSKALDWLINKAKPAIDQLAQLPPWKPTLVSKQQRNDDVAEKENANENEFRFLQSFNNNNSSNSFVPFETETTSSSPIQFQNYNNSTPDLLSRSNSNDLRLSLQQNQNLLFSGNFDGIPVTWNSGCGGGGDGGATIDTGSGGGGGSHNDDASGGGFVFRTPSPSPVVFPAVMYGQNQYLSQRGPLQSSYSPSVRAWIDAPTFVAADYRRQTVATSALGAGFASGSFSGFRVPARIGGDEEEVHGGVSVSDRPSSASSDSRR